MPKTIYDIAENIFVSYKKGHLSIETMRLLFSGLRKNYSADEIFEITREFLRMIGEDKKCESDIYI